MGATYGGLERGVKIKLYFFFLFQKKGLNFLFERITGVATWNSPSCGS